MPGLILGRHAPLRIRPRGVSGSYWLIDLLLDFCGLVVIVDTQVWSSSFPLFSLCRFSGLGGAGGCPEVVVPAAERHSWEGVAVLCPVTCLVCGVVRAVTLLLLSDQDGLLWDDLPWSMVSSFPPSMGLCPEAQDAILILLILAGSIPVLVVVASVIPSSVVGVTSRPSGRGVTAVTLITASC